MRDWSLVTIDDVAEVQTGFAFPSKRFETSPAPDRVRLLRGDNIVQLATRWTGAKYWPLPVEDRHRYYELKVGDIVLAMDRPWIEAGLKVARLRDNDLPAILVQRVARLRAKCHGTDQAFLYYTLTSPRFTRFVRGIETGTAVPHISERQIRSFTFHAPPLAEQCAIAGVLGALDDKIELNRRMNRTLEQLAATLFRAWFVDFEPVRAKAEGRPPAGIDAATAALFPDRLVGSAVGEIPAGWQIRRVGDIAEINGWTLRKSDSLGRIDYIEISAVSRGDIANVSSYERGAEPGRARRRLRHGDTALSTVRPDRGSYFLALDPHPELIASTGFAVATPVRIPWTVLHSALVQPEVFDSLGQMADGSAYPAVPPEAIADLPVALPTCKQIPEAFHDCTAPLFERMEANRRQNATLASLRDLLLPRLLSGELRVAAVEALVP